MCRSGCEGWAADASAFSSSSSLFFTTLLSRRSVPLTVCPFPRCSFALPLPIPACVPAPLSTAGPAGRTGASLETQPVPSSCWGSLQCHPARTHGGKQGFTPLPAKKKQAVTSTLGLATLISGCVGRNKLCQQESLWYSCLKIRTALFLVVLKCNITLRTPLKEKQSKARGYERSWRSPVPLPRQSNTVVNTVGQSRNPSWGGIFSFHRPWHWNSCRMEGGSGNFFAIWWIALARKASGAKMTLQTASAISTHQIVSSPWDLNIWETLASPSSVGYAQDHCLGQAKLAPPENTVHLGARSLQNTSITSQPARWNTRFFQIGKKKGRGKAGDLGEQCLHPP